MPRTKQTKSKRNSTGCEHIVRDFNRLLRLRIHTVELDYKGLYQKFETSIQLALSRYPTEIQNLTLKELLIKDISPIKENIPSKTSSVIKQEKSSMKPPKSTNAKRTTAASDDGYQSESTASQASKVASGNKHSSESTSQGNNKTIKRSRSRSQETRSKLSSIQNIAKKDMMQTPKCKPMNNFVITPKIRLNSAMNVLRKPKDGEMVFSTQGSPLLVSTTVNDKTANINVPLRNGNVMSLLPFNETSLTDSLHLDEETKHQLKILQSHLDKVLN